MSKYTYHEVCMYAYGIAPDGTQCPADSTNPLLLVEGWTVYVRAYENKNDDTWDEPHCEDFATEGEATKQAEEWAQKYACGIDLY